MDLGERVSDIHGNLIAGEAIVGIIIFIILIINKFSYYWSLRSGFFGKIIAIFNFAIMGVILIAIFVILFFIIGVILNAIVRKKMGGPQSQILEEAKGTIEDSTKLINDRTAEIEKYQEELTLLTKVYDVLSNDKEHLADQFAQMDGNDIEDAVVEFVNHMLTE